VRTATTLVAIAIIVLVIGGLSYWVFGGNRQSVAPQSSSQPLTDVPAGATPPAAVQSVPPTVPPTAPPPTVPSVPSTASPATVLAAPPAAVPSVSPTAPQAAVSSVPPAAPPAAAPLAPPIGAPSVPPTTPPAAPPTAALAAPPVTDMPAEADMSEANRRQIQGALQRLGYYKGAIDGIFGPSTRAAIRRFQHAIGAHATGNLTEEDANRLVTRR
jgi:hypothetical protein